VRVPIADLSHLPTRCKFLALMPQWEFLDFLAGHARRYPSFHLMMRAEVTELLRDDRNVMGVVAKTPRGLVEIRADLVVAADGRGSVVREKARLPVVNLGAPMDVLWMRLTKRPTDPGQTLGRVSAGKIFIMLDRGDYWQCAYVIPKGAIEQIRAAGLQAFRDDVARLAPYLHDRLDELKDWNDIKLLTVRVDRLSRWHRPGLLCIGDAAHAMSPIGGVGINLAIQDAIATANILAAPLARGPVSESRLHALQRRREMPTRLTQRLQLFVQNNGIRNVLAAPGNQPLDLPLPFRILRRWKWPRRIPARLIGLGFRPEHIRSPQRPRSR
jgi:2-polyprenyl-6-methoxyphenol hydroxylase-like FAD-dependent oxidoreductase